MCQYVIYLGIKKIKAYRSILGNIMMSNDGRICFIVDPDKNIMENITSEISWQPF